ncbi:Cof-type HAD-IIB family hydrolase [Sphingobacterium psychroaquaticum]|uniref:Cof-type HAD-IIB family hydrolase n=1 Tax=Sphingobacterium psychroaquaticum TaxID=561061 RepID=UPI0021D06D95|nr:Cof-type HAD-IIB family hydrolase [Sphingobacterium psychroaquaticum]
MIKAAFFDIDGTLLSFKTHTISPLVINALYELRKNGVFVFAASGRSINQIREVVDFPFDGFISSNGACCMDANGIVLSHGMVPKRDIQQLVDYLKAGNGPFAFAYTTEAGMFAYNLNDKVKFHFVHTNVAFPIEVPLEEILDEDVLQITLYIDAEEEKELAERVMPNCEFTRWHELFADVNNMEFNKASGVQVMLDYYGIDRQKTVAFGDGGNDLKMLLFVEYGVAMGNAAQWIKDQTKYVTGSVDEDGVLNALIQFGLISPKIIADEFSGLG